MHISRVDIMCDAKSLKFSQMKEIWVLELICREREWTMFCVDAVEDSFPINEHERSEGVARQDSWSEQSNQVFHISETSDDAKYFNFGNRKFRTAE